MGRRIAIELLVIAAIGLALAALGPFGSYDIPLHLRAVLWIGFILAGYAIFRPMLAAARWLSEAAGIGRFPAQLLALTLGAIPLAFLVGFILSRLVPEGAPSPFELYLQVWGVGFGITLFMNHFLPTTIDEVPAAPPEPLAEPSPSGRARFLDRLPGSIGSPLLCLSMEDHYVRAHGPNGSALILLRLRDAMAELDGMPGLQVHRSWWVADQAVARVERNGDRIILHLVNGLAVPVARSQLGAVRARDWPGSACHPPSGA